MKKNILLILKLTFLLTIFSYCGKAQTKVKTDFSGTWVIDLPKSEFGEMPTYTANKQMKVIQSANQIKIERLTVDDANRDSTANETLPIDGNALEITGGDHRTRKITAQLTADGATLTIRIICSEPNDPETVRFDATETWSLDNHAGTLTVKKMVKVIDGTDYVIQVVYDKK